MARVPCPPLLQCPWVCVPAKVSAWDTFHSQPVSWPWAGLWRLGAVLEWRKVTVLAWSHVLLISIYIISIDDFLRHRSAWTPLCVLSRRPWPSSYPSSSVFSELDHGSDSEQWARGWTRPILRCWLFSRTPWQQNMGLGIDYETAEKAHHDEISSFGWFIFIPAIGIFPSQISPQTII